MVVGAISSNFLVLVFLFYSILRSLAFIDWGFILVLCPKRVGWESDSAVSIDRQRATVGAPLTAPAFR